MNDDNRPREGPSSASGDGVDRLLRQAGPRSQVPEPAVAELWEASRAAWREEVESRAGERSRRRRRWSLALAAAAALLLALGWPLWRAPQPAAVTVAAWTFLAGPVSAAGSDGSLVPRVGATLAAGTVAETAASPAGHAAVRLDGGAVVRMDAATRLRLAAASRLDLEAGAIYVDSAGAEIEIHTDWGVARNLGTRFEVRVRPGATSGAALRVRVREGQVAIERKQVTRQVSAGEELSVLADGSLSRGRVDPHDPEWSWIHAATPPFEIEGQSLRAFLDWIVAENGWRLEPLPAAVDASLLDKTLSGTIEGLPPEQALEAALPGYGLRHRLSDGKLVIELDR